MKASEGEEREEVGERKKTNQGGGEMGREIERRWESRGSGKREVLDEIKRNERRMKDVVEKGKKEAKEK